jgi:hypothetical protein
VISSSIQNRKRHHAMPVSSTVRTSWDASPALTGDVRRLGFVPVGLSTLTGATAVDALLRPGPLTWRPPV